MSSEPTASDPSSLVPSPGNLASLLARLTPTERAELDNLLGLTPGTAPLWRPLPGPQTQALLSPADVTGFGGAAGGAKSDLGLGLAITQHRRSLIIRREAVNLRALIDRCREILQDRGSYNGQEKVWRDIPGDRQIEFGGVKDAADVQLYRGRPHDLLFVDECDQVPGHVVRFLSGWVRTTIVGQRCRVVLAFNPPSSAEGEWLLEYFAPWIDEKHPHPANPGELRYYAMVDGKEVERPDGSPFRHKDEVIKPRSRTFIPARLADNPFLMATDYGSTLQALPEPLRSQLLYGDMKAGRKDDDYQVIPTEWVREAQARWTEDGGKGQPLTCVGVDPARGGSDKTVLAPRRGTWIGRLIKRPGKSTPDGTAVVDIIVQETRDQPDVPVNTDIIGIGAAVYDIYRQVRGARPVAVNFATGTNRRDRSGRLSFVNLRAWAYWYLREALDPERGDNLALPPDPELLADLTAPRWEQRASGIIVEPKEAIAKRIGRSPDCGDACVLSIIPVSGWECPSTCANPPHLGGSNPATGQRLSGGDRLRALLEQSRRRYSGGVPSNLNPFAGRPSRLTGG